MMRGLAGEDGFSLGEMMVCILLMLLVTFALYAVFDATVRAFAVGRDGVEAAQSARAGLERMEREIRAAYPQDRAADPPDLRLLTAMTPGRIAFGNDRGAGDRRIDPATEGISYALSAGGPPYTLQRTSGTGSPQPVVGGVGRCPGGAPGLGFEYLRGDGGALAPTAVESEVEVVRITLCTEVDGRRRMLRTAVELRNRG